MFDPGLLADKFNNRGRTNAGAVPMNIVVEWQKPILLSRFNKLCFANPVFPQIEPIAGVYFFSRKFATVYEPFYVGETGDLRRRVREHLESAKIFKILSGLDDNFKHGARYLHYGYMTGRKTKNAAKRRHIVQEFLIERALAEDIPLLNTQLINTNLH